MELLFFSARLLLGATLLSISAWIVAWRRARPDLCPLWLAASLCTLLGSIACASFAIAFGQTPVAAFLIVLATVAGVAVSLRLWVDRRTLLAPAGDDLSAEARRYVLAAMDLVKQAERQQERSSNVPEPH